MGRPAAGKSLQQGEITANEGLLLGPAPSLELSFGFNGIRSAIKPVRKHQFDRASRLGVTRKCSRVVLVNSRLEARTGGTDVKATVAAFDDVEISSIRHMARPILPRLAKRFQPLMVRSAAQPRVSNHEAPTTFAAVTPAPRRGLVRRRSRPCWHNRARLPRAGNSSIHARHCRSRRAQVARPRR